MTRLERVIEQVKEARKGDEKHRPWIFDANGKIRDDVICGEVLDFLEELKDYEVSKNELSDEEMEKIQMSDYDSADNTYNVNANISNDINYHRKKIGDEYVYVMMIHLCGDIRGGYSDCFAVKFDYECDMYCLESVTQHKYINDRYCADINIFSECYDVYDYETDDYVDGTFYEIEKGDALKKISEANNKAC